ncbi:MAG TPA: Gfo/Idh/MocA family oxidoreductase [Gaiellaceae bacterium]
MRFAIVGCGDISGRYARRIAETAGLELAGATRVGPGRADALVAEAGGTSYPSLGALLGDDRVDAVVNLTGALSHATVTRAALEARKHVHTEKPLALTHAEAQELVELAGRQGLVLSCAPATLMGEAQQTAWQLLREGAIGTVRVVDWGRARVELRDAVADGREPRASARHAAHVVEALEAIDRSRRNGGAVDVASDFEQPAPMEWAR